MLQQKMESLEDDSSSEDETHTFGEEDTTFDIAWADEESTVELNCDKYSTQKKKWQEMTKEKNVLLRENFTDANLAKFIISQFTSGNAKSKANQKAASTFTN
jgi:hypothetical protein